MPRPPPRSSSGSSTPARRGSSRAARRRGARRPRSRRCRRSASRCGECRPTSSSDGSVEHPAHRLERPRRSRSEKPNFWSSCAVAMNSWVCASTPTVTRTSTRCRTPAASAACASRAISCRESTTIRPTPAATARASSVDRLVVAVHRIRSAGKPAASATASSPPVQTSSAEPLLERSSARPSLDRKPCRRSRRRRPAERGAVAAAARADVVLVERRRPGVPCSRDQVA